MAEEKVKETENTETENTETKAGKLKITNPALLELTAKMQEYVKMEEELEFSIFSGYYQDVMVCLQADYQLLSMDELVAAEAVCGIMGANAGGRALKKDANRKKFQKMQEKSEFWQKAIKARLLKEGLTEAAIAEKAEGLWA